MAQLTRTKRTEDGRIYLSEGIEKGRVILTGPIHFYVKTSGLFTLGIVDR